MYKLKTKVRRIWGLRALAGMHTFPAITPPHMHAHTHTHTYTLTHYADTPVTKIILPMSHDRGIVLLCSSGQTNRFENRMWTHCLATWKERDKLKFYPILQTKVPWKYSFDQSEGCIIPKDSLVIFEHMTRLTSSYS